MVNDYCIKRELEHNVNEGRGNDGKFEFCCDHSLEKGFIV